MKKNYFISDFHLGNPNYEQSFKRELTLIRFIQSIKDQIEQLFILGDMFDFWFEYKYVIPKGYVRFLSTLADLTDHDIPVHIFTGNHDLWLKDYLIKEIGVKIYYSPQRFIINDKKLYIGHGDGLGPKDLKYKFLKKIFTNSVCQYLFKWIHPDLSFGLANYFSQSSRIKQSQESKVFLGEKKEWLISYCLEVLKNEEIDYFIFGHRHLPIFHQLSPTSIYINTGDWLSFNSYAELENQQLVIKYFK